MEDTNINETETTETEETTFAVSETVRVLALSAATTVAIMAGPAVLDKVKTRLQARKARKLAEQDATQTLITQE